MTSRRTVIVNVLRQEEAIEAECVKLVEGLPALLRASMTSRSDPGVGEGLAATEAAAELLIGHRPGC